MAVPKVLKKALLPDSFTRSLFALSPYRGCAHGCKYCDGRAEKYYVPGDFEKDVEAREFQPPVLREELANLRERGLVTLGSGVTDVYQPLEARKGLTRQLLELLAEKELPVQILTKSALVVRDLDILGPLARKSGAILLVSLTSLDTGLLKTLEPGASPPADRLEALRAAREAGLTIGVLAMPLLPGITDTLESTQRLGEALVALRPDFVVPGGLTLRPGRQKDLFFSTLEDLAPALLPRYRELFGEDRASGMPRRSAPDPAEALGGLLRLAGIPDRTPPEVSRKVLPAGDFLYLQLLDMEDFFRKKGVDTRRLKASLERYVEWWTGLRSHFRRHRTLEPGWLDQRLNEAATLGELEDLVNNPKLYRTMASILQGGWWDSRNQLLAQLAK